MSIKSVKDISDAWDAGRFHITPFRKNAGVTGDGQWQDWSYTSGMPPYESRLGLGSLKFSPYIATNNDAIYFPPIPSGATRHLLSYSMDALGSGADIFSVGFRLYDLVGVYPLIDGDSGDLQVMDNTLTLPRYTDGVGVNMLLVNQVAPLLTTEAITVEYVDSDDVTRTLSFRNTAAGLNKVSYTWASGGSNGSLYIPGQGRGIKRVNSLQFGVGPGGLWAIYLVRPIDDFTWQGGLNVPTGTTWRGHLERDLSRAKSFQLPIIPDGASLGFFYMPQCSATARTVSLFGSFTFIWG